MEKSMRIKILEKEKYQRYLELNGHFMDEHAFQWGHFFVMGLTIDPKRWTLKEDWVTANSVGYRQVGGSLLVRLSWSVELDEKKWLHLSFSRPSVIPMYDDMTRCKDTFIGRDRKAYLILPEQNKHISTMDYCLHLWSCMEEKGDSMPDFTRGTNQI